MRPLLAVLLLSLLSGGCSGDSLQECLVGARICDGSVVMLCSPDTGSFLPEQTCDFGLQCQAGECVPTGFSDTGFPDTAATDTATPDAGAPDAGASDVGPPDVHRGRDTTPPQDIPGSAEPEPEVLVEPEPEVSTPGADTSEPEPEVSEPEPEVSTPGADTTEPEPEVSSPEPEPEVAVEPTEDVPLEVAVPDVGPEDVGLSDVLDVQPPEEVAAEDATSDASDPVELPFEEPPFQPGNHLFEYTPVPNILIVGDFHRVRWHPSGEFALLLGPSGKLVRYDAATNALSLVDTLAGGLQAIEPDPTGAYFLVMTTPEEDQAALWRVAVGEDTTLTVTLELELTTGEAATIKPAPDGTQWLLGTRTKVAGGSYLNTLALWSEADGVTQSTTFAGPGLHDAMWADVPAYAGSPALVTSEGINGADSRTWVVQTDLLVGNGWSPGFGNVGRSQWRPNGTYGFAMGYPSGLVYVFDGTWTKQDIPVLPNGVSPNAIRWKRDGSRALIVGRVVGSPLYATVVDHRPGDSVAFDASDPNTLLNQSIQGFAESPWNGHSNMHMTGVDWRPGNCDEGLIVGWDNGSQFNPAFGTVIRFEDPDDPWCALD